MNRWNHTSVCDKAFCEMRIANICKSEGRDGMQFDELV